MATKNTNKVEETEAAVEAKAKESTTTTKSAPKKARKFAMDDPITCRSVTYGELLLPGKKSQLLYSWANYGDTTEVEYQDLQALRSTRSAYLNAPMFVIEDEELLEQWPELKTIYDKVMSVDIDKLFKLPINQFKAKLRNFPASYRENIKNIASEMILSGELDSLAKIKAIDEILGTDLKFYIE